MENKNGLENMGWSELGLRMNQFDGSEIRKAARVSHELRQAGLSRAAWYCCLLVRLGEMLVSMGTHLKVRYSVRSITRAN